MLKIIVRVWPALGSLAPEQLFDQSFGMFVPAGKEGRYLWFNKDCTWADEEYALVGLLVGLAVYAGVLLDVPLPLIVFRKVLGHQLSIWVSEVRACCSLSTVCLARTWAWLFGRPLEWNICCVCVCLRGVACCSRVSQPRGC